jgi:hypothetical protein
MYKDEYLTPVIEMNKRETYGIRTGADPALLVLKRTELTDDKM